MNEDGFDRRAFLKGTLAGGAAAVATTLQAPAQAQSAPPASAAQPPVYAFLNPEEAAFIEAAVDHMIPADEHTPKGTDLGLNIFIDRALSGGWGKGERLYLQGPWKAGVPSQGYQLPLTPAALYRAGIAAANAACVKAYGKPSDKLAPAQREAFLLDLRAGKAPLEGGPPPRV